MSQLRRECRSTTRPSIPNETALYLIRDSVAARGCLIHGRLHDEHGRHCAIGCFFADNPNAVLCHATTEQAPA